LQKDLISYKVIFPSADIISERKNATFDYKMLHFYVASLSVFISYPDKEKTG